MMSVFKGYITPLLIASAFTLVLSAASGSRAAYLYVKANAAQFLLEKAWASALIEQRPVKPWSWADTTTAAQLTYTLHDGRTLEKLIVLDNASGEAMAFGPGLVAGELHNAHRNTIVLGGHRDTHLAFLEFADTSTVFELQTSNGQTHQYRFDGSDVVDSSRHQLQVATNTPGLVLITCYPFNALQTGGPLRMVVRAKRIDV